MARWLCECERTVSGDLPACWSCGRPRPTTTDDVVVRLTAEVATLTAERDEALANATVERTTANEWLAQLHDVTKERDEAREQLDKWTRSCPEDVRGVLEHIDMLVPDSDIAYDSDALDARRDEYVRLMYAAADGCAQMLRERDEARGLLREALPLMHGDYDDEIEMRARIAAHLEGRR